MDAAWASPLAVVAEAIPWRLVYAAAILVGSLAAWRPAHARFACQLVRRGLELTWLYLPLAPWLLLCCLADRLAAQLFRPDPAAKGGSWVDGWWELLRRRAQRSGPVFVKLGQWAATRPDLLPEELCAALKKLHDCTEPHALAFTHKTLDEAFPASLGQGPWYKHLLIEPEPVGSGCIAQVYVGQLVVAEGDGRKPAGVASEAAGVAAAGGACSSSTSAARPTRCLDGLRRLCVPCLPGGADAAGKTNRIVKVAVKVVHPQVQRAVDVDLKVLHMAATVSDYLGLDHLGLSLMLRQFADFLLAQADLRQEAENLRAFWERLGGPAGADGPVAVPQVFDRWVARGALVMTFEEGRPLSELLRADSAALGREKLEAWRHLVELFWAMVFKHRLVHGDMHPGNLFWRRGRAGVQLVLLDCGLAIDLGGDAGEDLSMMVKAFLTRPEEEVASLLIQLSERVGGKPEDVVDREGFIQGIADLIREGFSVKFKLSKLNAGALMGRSLLLGRRHRVRFDARFVNLMAAMVVLQGVALQLNGEGDIIGKMIPHVLGAAVSGLRAGRGGRGGGISGAGGPAAAAEAGKQNSGQ